MRRNYLLVVRALKIFTFVAISSVVFLFNVIINLPENDHAGPKQTLQDSPKPTHRRRLGSSSMLEFKLGYNGTFYELQGQQSPCSPSEHVHQPFHKPSWNKLLESIYVYSPHVKDKEIHFIALADINKGTLYNDTACECTFGSLEYRSTVRIQNTKYDYEGEKFRSVRLVCRRPEPAHGKVQIFCQSADSCGKISYELKSPSQKQGRLSFALCGPILWGSPSPRLLIEFIEYYKEIGVRHFVFYDNEPGSDIRRVLNYYLTESIWNGMITVLPWKLPVSNQVVNYFGQLAAINDCLERTKDKWDYSLFVDLDEFVAMTDASSLTNLVRHGIIDCLIVRSSFVQMAKRDTADLCGPRQPLYIEDTSREAFVFPEQERSKYVCRGKNVLSAGIHFPHYITGDTRIQVAHPDRDGIVLHFRTHMGKEKRKYVTDYRAKTKVQTIESIVKRVVDNVCANVVD